MNVLDWDIKKVIIIAAAIIVLSLVVYLFVNIAVPIIKTKNMTEQSANSGVSNMNVQNVDKFNEQFKKYETNKNVSSAVVREMIQAFITSNSYEDQSHFIKASFRGVDYDKDDLKSIIKELDKTPYSSYSIKLEKDKKDYYCKATIDVVEESKRNR